MLFNVMAAGAYTELAWR